MTEKPAFAFPETDWCLVVDALVNKGRIVLPNALPVALWQGLQQRAKERLQQADFHEARIGRGAVEMREASIRSDSICWLQEDHEWEAAWLNWMHELQRVLNRELYLGINDYEAHFAHYPAGAFYKKHVDRHRDSNARVVTTVFYLNENWQEGEGGELVIYDEEGNAVDKENPVGGKLVLFMSEGLLHEVLPASRERWSVTGWFRR